MTKQEILYNEGFDFSAFEYENEYSAKSILQAMSDYAKEMAICFKEWHDENLEDRTWEQYDSPQIWINPHTRQIKTTKELYQIFLDQKKK